MSFVKTTVTIQITMNLLNIMLDLIFVNVFSRGVSGVAAATLIAEVTALAMGMFVIFKGTTLSFNLLPIKQIFDMAALKKWSL